MSATPQPRSLADRLRRVLAVGCAGLVLALTILAASPVAHNALHHDEVAGSSSSHAPSEDDCAVVLFASGVSLPVGPFALTPPTAVAQGLSPVTAAAVFLVSPRYLRRPERGPPRLG